MTPAAAALSLLLVLCSLPGGRTTLPDCGPLRGQGAPDLPSCLQVLTLQLAVPTPGWCMPQLAAKLTTKTSQAVMAALSAAGTGVRTRRGGLQGMHACHMQYIRTWRVCINVTPAQLQLPRHPSTSRVWQPMPHWSRWMTWHVPSCCRPWQALCAADNPGNPVYLPRPAGPLQSQSCSPSRPP